MGLMFSKKQKTDELIAIEQFVDKILQNSDINLSCLHDILEKPMYVSLIKVLLGNIKEASKTFKLEFLNHTLTIHIEPNLNTQKN